MAEEAALSALAGVVPRAEDQNTRKDVQVQAMFDRIARRYDLLNDVISMGMHRGWKQEACGLLKLKPGSHVLDVCTGTGDLCRWLLSAVGEAGQVTGLDFSADMLAVARHRFGGRGNVRFDQGDAMQLPYEDHCFDGAIISFGLRNVLDVPRAIAEMTRVVKPGGWVVNLDTCPEPGMPGYWLYFSLVMPTLGRWISGDPSAYAYLSRSTRAFLPPAELERVFEEAGLSEVQTQLRSMRSVAMQAGRKPAGLIPG
ncbi:MAG: bifunctional demethylmenaquinone methyltransferase/2-methoxy-6-polyprenyl-1,4-benzoquinol methylase UbiE [Candidatus Melainabacteria bacterium]